MHTSEVMPILRAIHQSRTHRIFPDVLPLVRVALAVAQPVMKSASLNRSGIWMRFGKSVFPEANPTLNGELRITGRAKEMEVSPSFCAASSHRAERVLQRIRDG